MKSIDEFKAWLKNQVDAAAIKSVAPRRLTTRITSHLIEVVDEEGRAHLRIGDVGQASI
ncbi:hypothetical protein [Burkholderia ubonensis]|uniref:hypothetical protein n=1 Tax=Burkholderia ubonensis TaxID=101571 RepID=UPI000A50E69E|nr:hypothetical protein [Burkholderia ubonensis]